MIEEKSAYQASQVSLTSCLSKYSNPNSLSKEKYQEHEKYPPKSAHHPSSASTPTLVGSISHHPAESSTTGGHRLPISQTLHLPRGVVTRTIHADDWLARVQNILQYTFTTPDLLEEALESPGSGITIVGKSSRQCTDGNKGLAKIGKSAMKLVLKDSCYTLRMSDSTSLYPLGKGLESFRALIKVGSTKRTIANILAWRNLDRLGRTSSLEQFVRPKMRPEGSKGKNPWYLVKDDVAREDPTRTVARAVKAVVGAVYFDGGFAAVRMVMEVLDLVIRVPGN